MSIDRGGKSKGGALAPGKIAAVLAVIAVSLGTFAFLRAGDGEQERLGHEGYAGVHQAICDAGAAVRSADAFAARDIFYDRAHSGLHVLADELTGSDRSLAADLLRAKNAVEGSLDPPIDPQAASHLDELLRVSQIALESLGAPYSPCTP